FLFLLVVMPFGPLLAWKRGDLFAAAQRLTLVAGLAVVLAAAALYIMGAGGLLAGAGLFVAIFAIAGALAELAERLALFREPISHSFGRARGQPRAAWGTTLAHAGIGIALLGVVAESGWSVERVAMLKPGER